MNNFTQNEKNIGEKTIANTAVIGAGGWGTAMAKLLCENGHNVSLWVRTQKKCDEIKNAGENKEYLPGVKLESSINFTADLACIKNCKYIFIATPSKAIREICKKINKTANDGSIIVILSKGFENDTLCTMSDVAKQCLPKAKICVMSGPSHAEEVARGIPTLNVAASNDESICKAVQNICMNDYFRVYTSSDMLGVELGGALKNVIALCAGIIDGIGFGDNTKAALMTRGIKEIARLGVKMGANGDTFWGLSGIGDLIVTCTSMHSRNRRAGILIGKGLSVDETLKTVHMVVEGIQNAKAAYELSLKYNTQMPIIHQAYKVLYENKNPKDAVMDLMVRNKKDENM